MAAVVSTAIRDIDYAASARLLRVRFADGRWYRYAGVPLAVARAFLAAGSHGRFFQQHIRGRYAYQREARPFAEAARQ